MSTGFADPCSCSCNDRRAAIKFVLCHMTSFSPADCQAPYSEQLRPGTSKDQSSLHPMWLFVFLLPRRTALHSVIISSRSSRMPCVLCSYHIAPAPPRGLEGTCRSAR